MSVTKTGWIIAAAAAAAFAAGCAGQGQGHVDNMGASCAGEPAIAATHGCKNVSECKQKVVKHHRHHVEKKVKTEVDGDKESTTTTTKEETKSESEAAK